MGIRKQDKTDCGWVRVRFILAACLLAGAGSGWAEPTKVVRGFVDFNFGASDAKGSHSQFGLGEYDTYITGDLDERISYLSEVTFKYSGGWALAIERVWARYYLRESFSVSVGKFHTALGYWNRAYHHGSLLFSSIDKPITRTVFPIHTTGLLFSGREISAARLYYDIMIGNGIGSTPTADNDEFKSVNVHVYSKVVDGVELGFSLYKDRVEQGATGLKEVSRQRNGRAEDIDLLILMPSLVVEINPVDLEAEWALMQTEGDASNAKETSQALYLLAAYNFADFAPFVKFDYLNIKPGDPFYLPEESTTIAGGIRFDLSHLSSVKVQYSYKDTRGADAVNALKMQLAIGL